MNIISLETLKKNIDHSAHIAHELETRLYEHLSHPIANGKKWDILRDCTAEEIVGEKWPETQGQFDLIIAHFIPLWQKDLNLFLEKMGQLLSEKGILLFSTLGRYEAYELENLGDQLHRSGFMMPVVDKEIVEWSYDSRLSLHQDLNDSGLNKNQVRINDKNPQHIIMDIEVIYAHARGRTKKANVSSTIEIPLDQIVRKKKTIDMDGKH